MHSSLHLLEQIYIVFVDELYFVCNNFSIYIAFGKLSLRKLIVEKIDSCNHNRVQVTDSIRANVYHVACAYKGHRDVVDRADNAYLLVPLLHVQFPQEVDDES